MKRMMWLAGVLMVWASLSGWLDARGAGRKVTLNDVNRMMVAFDGVIRKDNGKNRQVLERYQFFKTKMKNQELQIVVDHNLPEDIYDGMGFDPDYPGVNQPGIGISPYFVSVHRKAPSIVYAALMHQIQHVYDYFTNRELFLVSQNNMLEKYLFETDAVYMEGMFIRDCLSAQNYKLTSYESFLLQSMEQDNLARFSTVAMGIDMDIAYGLVRISKAGQPKGEKLQMVEAMGRKLMEATAIPENTPELKKYNIAVQLATYCLFAPQTLADIEARENPAYDCQAFRLEDYPEIHAKIDKMFELLEDYQGLMNRVRAVVLEGFRV